MTNASCKFDSCPGHQAKSKNFDLAHVVKLVNTLHSGCSERTLLEVRVFSWALKRNRLLTDFFFFQKDVFLIFFLYFCTFENC